MIAHDRYKKLNKKKLLQGPIAQLGSGYTRLNRQKQRTLKVLIHILSALEIRVSGVQIPLGPFTNPGGNSTVFLLGFPLGKYD